MPTERASDVSASCVVYTKSSVSNRDMFSQVLLHAVQHNCRYKQSKTCLVCHLWVTSHTFHAAGQEKEVSNSGPSASQQCHSEAC